MTIFGRLLPLSRIEAAVAAQVAVWAEDYLAEVERQDGIAAGTLARPRSYQSSYDMENWPEGQLPAIITVCPGTAGEIERYDGGTYGAWFEMQVGALVEDTTEAQARRVAALYQSAIEGALLQHGKLGDLGATHTRLYARALRLPDVNDRTLALGECTFHIYVADFVTERGGPATPQAPPGEPYADWPTVTRTDVQFGD